MDFISKAHWLQLGGKKVSPYGTGESVAIPLEGTVSGALKGAVYEDR